MMGLRSWTAARSVPGAEGEGEAASVAELLEAVLAQTGYVEALEAERSIEAQGRIENLEQLVEVGREFDEAEGEDTLERFLQEIALVADADGRSDDEGLVTLMTLHNAKGLEYPTVFITGLEDGVFPHSRAIDEGGLEEERRLFYVGVTRAMRKLYLTHARRRAVFGAQSYGMPSRFLAEIPGDLLDEGGDSGGWRPGVTVTPSLARGGETTWRTPTARRGTAPVGGDPGVPPRRGRRARRIRRRRRHRGRARRRDRRALRRRRLGTQADGGVRARSAKR